VKNRYSLQTKLEKVLQGTPALKILPPSSVWSEADLAEVAWIVEDFVNQNPEVVEDDNRLKDWLDEYKFYRTAFK
jgi:hypothetical protein